MKLQKRLRLFFRVIPIVVLLVAAKVAIHQFDFEFIALNDLVPSLVAGPIFILGFLLSQVLSDYKEAERLPSEIRVALEAIHDDVMLLSATTPNVDVVGLRHVLSEIVTTLELCVGKEESHSDLKRVIAKVDELSPRLAALERFGLSQQALVRLRSQQDVLRRSLFRIYYMQRMQFLPSVHVLVQTIAFMSLGLLLFLRTEDAVESLIFGLVTYIFVYALYLIEILEQPFRKGQGSLDDVSLFLLREFADKLDTLRK
jgi:hypothetical protein